MWCSLKTKRRGGGLLGQHSQNAEKRRWIWTGFHYRTKLLCTAEPWWAPFIETTMWMAPPRARRGTTCVSVLSTVCSCILFFVWLPHVEISLQFEENPNYRKAGPQFPLWSPKEIHISPSPRLGCGQVSVKVSQPVLLPRILHLNTVTWKCRLSGDHQRQH